jgi:hypothetical protein
VSIAGDIDDARSVGLGSLHPAELHLGAACDVLDRRGNPTGALTGINGGCVHLCRGQLNALRRLSDLVDEPAKLRGRAVVRFVGGDHRLAQVSGEIEHRPDLVPGTLGGRAGSTAPWPQLDRQIPVGQGLKSRHQLKPHRPRGTSHMLVGQPSVTMKRRHRDQRHPDAEGDADPGHDQRE